MLLSVIHAFEATIAITGSPWQRGGVDGPSFEWLSGETPVELPEDFPEIIDIELVDGTGTTVSVITTGNPSHNARWIFSGVHKVSENAPDGDYYIKLINASDEDDFAISEDTVTIEGDAPQAVEDEDEVTGNDDEAFFGSSHTMTTVMGVAIICYQ